MYFANAITFSSNNLIRETALISKVYFPRLIAPMVLCPCYLRVLPLKWQ